MAEDSAYPLTPENLSALAGRLQVPVYDRGALPGGIVHIGVGGFHRAHQALYLDELIAAGDTEWSIVGAGVMPGDARTRDAAKAQTGLYTLIEKDRDGRVARVVGSIGRYLFGPDDPDALVEAMADESTRIVSLTITEGGYPVDEQTLVFDPTDRGVVDDLAAPDREPAGAIGAIVSALKRRLERGLAPFTVQSCDNVVHNGKVARAAIVGMARAWSGDELAEWIAAEGAFPNSMVDRITPAAASEDAEWLAAELGVKDLWPIASEPFRQWVIEDDFPLGRPAWEDVGALMTPDVEPYELSKIRLLNAGHSAIAYLGAMRGHEFIHEVMADEPIARFYAALMEREISPTLPTIADLDLPEYRSQLIRRFANPEIRDQVARVCLDGSVKLPKFTVPIVTEQLAAGRSTALLALALAGWAHYLASAEDEAGEPIDHAPDPHLDEARDHAQASLADPAAFLDFAFVFGEASDEAAFRDAFADALEALRREGVHGAISRAISS